MSAPAPAPGPMGDAGAPAPAAPPTLAEGLPALPLPGGTTLSQDINVSFVLQSGYLVFFMHCGFAMLSIGSVRSRFAKHISILILVDACMSALGFYLFGYAVAFGDKVVDVSGTPTLVNNDFIGTEGVALGGQPGSVFFFWLFEWAFAATACTIVSGAICERTRIEAYMLYSFFMSVWVYPIVVHSVWSNAGWASMFRNVAISSNLNVVGFGDHLQKYLFGSGVIDFAGSGAVHMVGGYGAIAGAAVLGPRIGRFLPDGTVVDMPGHNTSLFLLGVMILWFGWYGFNPGSQLAIIGYSIPVANAAVTTTLAPAAAGITAFVARAVISRFTTGQAHWDIMAMGNGSLAGLAAITAPCSTVYPWAAVIIGIIAGGFYLVGSKVSVLCRLDDPLDAIAVHAWGGTLGILLTGAFAAPQLITNSYGLNVDGNQRPYGFIMGGNGQLLASQIVYAIWVASWVTINMAIFFFILKMLGLFRVAPEIETVGLDHSYHGGSAYPGGPEEMSDEGLRGKGGNGNGGLPSGKGANGGDDSSVTRGDFESLKAEVAALKKGGMAV